MHRIEAFNVLHGATSSTVLIALIRAVNTYEVYVTNYQ